MNTPRILAIAAMLVCAACVALGQSGQQTFNNCTVVVDSTGGKIMITCPTTPPPPPLTITTPVTLGRGKVNVPYITNLAVLAAPKGGVPPYTYTINPANPTPPAWLKLSSAGMLTGTPTTAGAFPFNFTVKDSAVGGAHATVGTAVVAATIGR